MCHVICSGDSRPYFSAKHTWEQCLLHYVANGNILTQKWTFRWQMIVQALWPMHSLTFAKGDISEAGLLPSGVGCRSPGCELQPLEKPWYQHFIFFFFKYTVVSAAFKVVIWQQKLSQHIMNYRNSTALHEKEKGRENTWEVWVTK